MSLVVHRAPWVLPMGAPPLRDGGVAVDERGRVAAVGAVAALRPLGDVVEHDAVIMPGLINAHLHLELSHLHVPGGAGLVPWIRALIAARATLSDVAVAKQAATAAALAMGQRGTVGAIDISNDGTTGPLFVSANITARVLLERIAPRGDGSAPRTPDASGQPSRLPGVPGVIETAHATYTCSAAALRRIATLAGGHLPSIHVEEDPAEAQWLIDGAGPLRELLSERDALPTTPRPALRPVEWLESLGVLGRGTLLVHLTVADQASLELAARRDAIAVLCPRSNLHIGARLPPVEGVRAAGLRAALGTDSLASSPSLDVLGEVQALARAGVDPAWLLRAATVGGADAMGAPELGSLAVGKRPGLIAVGADAHGITDAPAFVAHEGADAPVRRIA
jgi:cytosine/adenosine deaminase-related metal-dependent hydrolase